jgi:uncharacterized protein
LQILAVKINNMSYLILILIVLIPSLIVSSTFKSKIKKYSKMPLYSGMSGKEIAEKMLADHGIYNVKVTLSRGLLSDHYNPQNRTVALSEGVYHGRSIASAGIAAHECGHAVQHARAYSFLQFRSAMVPVVTFSSRILTFIIIGGILLLNVFPELMLTGLILFAITTLFSFITLPVEFDASKRALVWLRQSSLSNSQEIQGMQDSLKWAAMTYVVAALGSLTTLVYYIMIFLGNRN